MYASNINSNRNGNSGNQINQNDDPFANGGNYMNGTNPIGMDPAAFSSMQNGMNIMETMAHNTNLAMMGNMNQNGINNNGSTLTNGGNNTSPPRASGMRALIGNSVSSIMGRKRKPSVQQEPQSMSPQEHLIMLQNQEILRLRQRQQQIMFQQRQEQQQLLLEQERQRQFVQAHNAMMGNMQPGHMLQTHPSMSDIGSMDMQIKQEPSSLNRQASFGMLNGNPQMVTSPIQTPNTTASEFNQMNNMPFSPILTSPQLAMQSPTAVASFPNMNMGLTSPYEAEAMSVYSGIDQASTFSGFSNAPSVMGSFDLQSPFDGSNIIGFDSVNGVPNAQGNPFSSPVASNFNTRNNSLAGSQYSMPLNMENNFYAPPANSIPILSQPPAPNRLRQQSSQQALMQQRISQQQQQQQQLQSSPPLPQSQSNVNQSQSPAQNESHSFDVWSLPPANPSKAPSLSTRPSTAAASQLQPGQSVLSPNGFTDDLMEDVQDQPSHVLSAQPSMVSSMGGLEDVDCDAKPKSGAKSSREMVPAELWEKKKPIIRQLYLDERRPLKHVMEVMRLEHNFNATPKMYKTRFSQWGFAKNNTEDEVKRLLHIKHARDAEGKPSEFVRNGRVVNLRTYLKRKGKTEEDLFEPAQPQADLPGHTRCRTPPALPNLPGHIAADVKRVQEIITSNMRKAMLLGKANDVTEVTWASVMFWGNASSDIVHNANGVYNRQTVDAGKAMLLNSNGYLERELKTATPLLLKELLFGIVNKHNVLIEDVCRFLGGWAAKSLDRSHPLRPILSSMLSLCQDHGAPTLSDLLWSTMPSFYDDLEAVYGPEHPYVVRTLLDLLEIAKEIHVQRQKVPGQYQSQPMSTEPDQTHAEYCDRIRALSQNLLSTLSQLEAEKGPHSDEAVALRYTLAQMHHATDPMSPQARQAVHALHTEMREGKRLYQIGYSGLWCYHEVIKAKPSTRRCTPRYDLIAQLLLEYENLAIQFYFEEELHTIDHGECDGHGGMTVDLSMSGYDGFEDYGANAALAAAQQYDGGMGGRYMWG